MTDDVQFDKKGRMKCSNCGARSWTVRLLLDGSHSVQGDTFKFTCSKCGKEYGAQAKCGKE